MLKTIWNATMIDYDKLKLAVELAAKTNNYYFTIAFATFVNSPNKIEICLEDANSTSDGECVKTLDKLIERLKELTQLKPKYGIGQLVWYADYHNSNGPIICDDIIDIYLSERLFREKEYRVKTSDKDLPERLFYPSREALIDAQIKYWTELREECDE